MSSGHTVRGRARQIVTQWLVVTALEAASNNQAIIWIHYLCKIKPVVRMIEKSELVESVMWITRCSRLLVKQKVIEKSVTSNMQLIFEADNYTGKMQLEQCKRLRSNSSK